MKDATALVMHPRFQEFKEGVDGMNEYELDALAEAIHVRRLIRLSRPFTSSQTITLAEAESRWGLKNLRQNSPEKPFRWQAGDQRGTWLTTVGAMIEAYGPEPEKSPTSLIESITSYAAKLLTGLDDPRALEKYQREREELFEYLTRKDILGAYLEAGDCAYYAIKAERNKLIDPARRDQLIEEAAWEVGLTVDQVLAVCEAKYRLRARPGNPKDDAAERVAVRGVLGL